MRTRKINNPFNVHRHVFRSPKFQSVVDEAIAFFDATPVYTLPPPDSFVGTGVYALYYMGGSPCNERGLYKKIAALNQDKPIQPIYVGKAVPPGWRSARSRETDAPVLYRRLREHGRSIQQAINLELESFQCRFMILIDTESDLVVPVEAELIRRYTPIWNTVIDGFGNHDPGSGRYNQAKSEWDVLHPGRPWAARLRGESPSLTQVVDKLRQALSGIS